MAISSLILRVKSLVAKPITASITATIILNLANLVTGIVLARALGPAARGHVAALAALAISTGTVAGLSLTDATIFFSGRRAADIQLVLGSAFVVLSTTVCLAWGVLSIAQHVVQEAGATNRISDIVPWIMYAGIMQGALFVQTIARSLGQFRLWFWLRVMGSWNYAIILVSLWLVVGLNERLVGLAICLGALIALVVGMAAMFRHIFPLQFSRESVVQIVGYGAKLHPSAIASTMRDQFDKVILIFFVPASAVGHYVIAIAIGTLIVSAGTSVDQVIFPRLSRITDFLERRAAYGDMVRKLVPVALLGTPIVLLVSPTLARLMFGQKFADHPLLIVGGAFVGILQAVKVLANVGLKIENRPGALGANEITGSLIGLTALPICVHAMGILGAPIASGLGVSISLSLTVHAIVKHYRQTSTV